MVFVLYCVLFVAAMVIYHALPLFVQGIVLVVNTLIPDPIPVIDEVLMSISTINKLRRAEKIMIFVKKHKTIVAYVAATALIILVYCFFVIHFG